MTMELLTELLLVALLLGVVAAVPVVHWPVGWTGSTTASRRLRRRWTRSCCAGRRGSADLAEAGAGSRPSLLLDDAAPGVPSNGPDTRPDPTAGSEGLAELEFPRPRRRR